MSRDQDHQASDASRQLFRVSTIPLDEVPLMETPRHEVHDAENVGRRPPVHHVSGTAGGSMPWNSWEVFDPRDGQAKHFTDRERTAEQIAVEEEQRTGEPRDYGRTGM